MLRVAIIRFPGSNCDEDTLRAAQEAGSNAFYVWHRETSLGGADAVLIPGGFSYGDYLRAGAIARFSPVMAAVRAHAEAGGAVLGICNGFQILCEAGLLPGALMRNAGLSFLSRPVDVRVESTATPFTSACKPGQVLRLPVANGEGRFEADAETLAVLEGEGRIVLRYVDGGFLDASMNPNGSVAEIAGIANATGNVVGMMPHPERVADPALGGSDGAIIFHSLVAWAPAPAQP
ncbi:MAG TPA: phosphoribosylformylglycinamidine synthase subunit PurQ [Gemmatimonadales bacterium]|nr:phosphoribosylformylglycinamidine synthase subunit PurQ [Gemmatimonadales bacterium]